MKEPLVKGGQGRSDDAVRVDGVTVGILIVSMGLFVFGCWVVTLIYG